MLRSRTPGKNGRSRRRSGDVPEDLDARAPDDAGVRHGRVQLRVCGESLGLLQSREVAGDEYQVVVPALGRLAWTGGHGNHRVERRF